MDRRLKNIQKEIDTLLLKQNLVKPDTIQEKFKAILDEFFAFHPYRDSKEEISELFVVALGSNDADEWTAQHRADTAFFVNALTNFIHDLEELHKVMNLKHN